MVNGTEDLGFWGRGEVLLFFILFFFGENDRHLLHYIEQVHPRKLKLDITVTVLFVVWGLLNFEMKNPFPFCARMGTFVYQIVH